MNLTPRENALMAYRHEIPEWVPCFYTDISLFQACPSGERYTGMDHGKDWFGIDWTFVPEVGAPMPTMEKHMEYGMHFYRQKTDAQDDTQI